jgi:hypothetical protein
VRRFLIAHRFLVVAFRTASATGCDVRCFTFHPWLLRTLVFTRTETYLLPAGGGHVLGEPS